MKIEVRINKKGFTLLETLLALIILSSGIILLTKSWGSSHMRVRKTQLAFEVESLLERKVAELDMKYKGKPIEAIPEEEVDDFGDKYKQYRWKMKSRLLELPNLAAMQKSKDGEAVNPIVTAVFTALTEHIRRTVKEMKVSVFYKAPEQNKELEYSVTLYMVDYNREIAVPGIGP